MKVEVSKAIEELKVQFDTASVAATDDSQGGAYVTIEPIVLGGRFRPGMTWVGFQIPAQYPYADIYPIFIGADVVRADGIPFVAPITSGHSFQGRPALQISRRSSAAQNGCQKAVTKILKVLDFLEKVP